MNTFTESLESHGVGVAVTNETVAQVLRRYLAARPSEATAAWAQALPSGDLSPLASRHTYPAHVTCGVVAVRADGRVLQIHHRRLDAWLQPGGHVEPDDNSLADAAVREFTEESGLSLSAGAGSLVGDGPVDVDAHLVPANPAKDEPEHTHIDLRYLVRLDTPAPPAPTRAPDPRRGPDQGRAGTAPGRAATAPPPATPVPVSDSDISLQLDEVNGFRWARLDDLPDKLRRQVRAALA